MEEASEACLEEATGAGLEEATGAYLEEATGAGQEEASLEDGAGPESDFRRRMDRIGEMAFGSLLAQPRRVRQGRRSPRPTTPDLGLGVDSSLLHEVQVKVT